MTEKRCYKCGKEITNSYYQLKQGYLCFNCGKEIVNLLSRKNDDSNKNQIQKERLIRKWVDKNFPYHYYTYGPDGKPIEYKKRRNKMIEYYVYEIQAFAWSDFEHHILLHKNEFTADEFFRMIERAKHKAKKARDAVIGIPSMYFPDDVIEILKKDYGFIESKHLVAHVGTYYTSKCEVEINDC